MMKAKKVLNISEEDEGDDGPPPGFDIIPVNSVFNQNKKSVEIDDLDDDDDGPPPGFDSFFAKTDKILESIQSCQVDDGKNSEETGKNNEKLEILQVSDSRNKEKIEFAQEDDDLGDDDGPPPGFNSIHVKKLELGDVSKPEKVVVNEVDIGVQPVHVKGGEKLEIGSEPVFQFQSKQSVGVKGDEQPGKGSEPVFQFQSKQPVGVRGDEKSRKGSEPVFQFQSKQSAGVKGDEKSGIGSKPIFQFQSRKVVNEHDKGVHLVNAKGGEKSGFGSKPVFQFEEKKTLELGIQSIDLKEDENEKNVGRYGINKGKMQSSEDDDDGPPPGWSSVPPQKPMIKYLIPNRQPLSAVSSGTETESARVMEEKKVRDDLEVGFQSVSMKEEEKERDGFGRKSHSFSVKGKEIGSRSAQVEKNNDDEGPPPGLDSFSLPKPSRKSPAPPQPRPSATASGKGQMVCGGCRTLLSYTVGSRFGQCACCKTVNLIVEEHQAGQVKCRGCAVLLMYPYGAPSVQCSSCLFVTKIGEQNKRPPLSKQQARRQHAS